jgi:hypothetical protein
MTEYRLEFDESAHDITRLLTNAASIEQPGGVEQCIFLDTRTQKNFLTHSKEIFIKEWPIDIMTNSNYCNAAAPSNSITFIESTPQHSACGR